MGCDIHLFIEAWKGESVPENPYGFTVMPQFRLSRDYAMFARLANVRGTHENAIPPRGLPSVVGYEAEGDNTLYVYEGGEDSEMACSPAQAERWVSEGASRVTWRKEDGSIGRITHPDWHSHSWLTPEEWDAAIADLERDSEWFLDVKYHIVSDILASYKRRGYNCRVVFWFDN